MTLTLLTPIILLVMASVVTLNAIAAYKSGLMKSIINLSVTVASAFAAALVASFGFGSLKDRIAFRITESGFFYEIKDTFGALSSIVNFAVSVLASLILFIPVYVAVIELSKLLVFLFFKIKTSKTKAKADFALDGDIDGYVSENASYVAKNNKRLALYVGVLCGVFMSIVFLSPITGAFRMASDVIDVAKTFDLVGEEDIDNDVFDSLERYSNDFMVVAVDSCGGRSLFNVTTLFVYSGEVTNISKELHTLSEMDIAGIFDSLDGKDEFDDEILSSFKWRTTG